jgi:hypothetical protein
MHSIKFSSFLIALLLSTAAFAQSSGGNGAGTAGGGTSDAPKAGGQSDAASGKTGGTPLYCE